MDSHNYDFYDRLSFQIPIALVIYGVFVAIGAGIVTSFVLCFLSDKSKEDNQEEGQQSCAGSKKLMRFFLASAFKDFTLRISNFFLFEFKHKKGKGGWNLAKDKCYLYGAQVHIYTLYVLQIFLVVFFYASLLVFWNAMAVDVMVHQCDPRFDCFPAYVANLTIIDNQPISTCSSVDVGDTFTVVCHRLAWDFSRAIGETGGFLFAMQLLANVVIYLAIKIHRILFRACLYYHARRSGVDVELGASLPPSMVSGIKKVTFLLAVILCGASFPVIWNIINIAMNFNPEVAFSRQQFLQQIVYAYFVATLLPTPLVVVIGLSPTNKLYDRPAADPSTTSDGNRRV